MNVRAEISDVEFEFINFISKYGRNYPSKSEYMHRLKVFSERYREIQEINADTTNTFTVGVNKFADFDGYDWEQMLNFKESPYDQSRMHVKKSLGQHPASLDWRDHNAVTGIKDQGRCGSCWSFSSAQGVEGAWAVAKGEL
eukprot:CAMPEP_0170545246 /NCGR_PEP_ID=MMETSP0211-20121228/3706_1 /TAXON_ID=311385 /ORGANISM="Pseudokeronopsis sp., Strain OXSARD2" /LENGTH=140 /DNA_ID=CAMNT_0010849101 /DNA_START=81 /DNA_END=503 /DNA_ORIENTATION=+